MEPKKCLRDMFGKIEESSTESRNLVLHMVEEGYPAEQALFVESELVWTSRENGFFSAHREELVSIEESGMNECDGVHFFAEILCQEKKLVICGGGHVSIPVIQMGRMIGFHVTVLEDRPKFADDARRAGADQVFCESFEQGLGRIAGDEDTYFVIVTRGHRYDMLCLEKIAAKRHAYIGMIGSRRRTALVKETLIEKGVSREVLEEVYTPIGLDIGAETPEEIAVAIIAEIIEVKNRKKKSFGYTRELMQAIRDPKLQEDNMVLTTIIARRGSAPRGVGSRMLVLPDGNSVGTIGGGCAESNVLRKAIQMIRGGEEKQIVRVDMSGNDAEEDGMVCGGVIDVLMEMI